MSAVKTHEIKVLIHCVCHQVNWNLSTVCVK